MSAITNLIENYFEKSKKTKQVSVQAFNEKATEVTKIINKDFNEKKSKEILVFIDQLFEKFKSLNTALSDVRDLIASVSLLKSFFDRQFFLKEEAFRQSFDYLKSILVLPALNYSNKLDVAAVYGLVLNKRGINAVDEVDGVVTEILLWLGSIANDNLKLVAAILLTEIAKNAETLFNIHLFKILNPIWTVLRHPKAQTRETAILCIRAIITLFGKRDEKQKINCFDLIYNEAIAGFAKDTPENTQSSIAVLGELVRNGGTYIKRNYGKACLKILSFAEHKDKNVARTVIKLIPPLARYDPGHFSEHNEGECMRALLRLAKADKFNRDVCFVAVGEVVLALDGKTSIKINTITDIIKDTLASNKNQTSENTRNLLKSVFYCVCSLAQAFKIKFEPFAKNIIDSIFEISLTVESVNALYNIHTYAPNSDYTLENRLSDSLTEILRQNLEQNVNFETNSIRKQLKSIISKASVDSFSSKSFFRKKSTKDFTESKELGSDEIISLALKTLRLFNLSDQNELGFVRNLVAPYLGNRSSEIREQAALSCAKLLLDSCKDIEMNDWYNREATVEVLERLITTGVSDPNEKIRTTILASLKEEFDIFLCQRVFLCSLFISINDECTVVRALTITLLGRLLKKNPAFIYPTLRATLVQLLSEVRFCKNSVRKGDSALLLGHLLAAAPKMFRFYTRPILDSLLPHIRRENSDPQIATNALSAIGSLAKASGDLMRPYEATLFPLIIAIFRNKNSPISREVSLRALRQMTADVVSPYERHKELLPALLTSMRPENEYAVRREASRLVGFLGAWDPAQLSEMVEQEKARQSDGAEEQPFADSNCACHYSEFDGKYFAYVAVNALIKILNDSSLSHLHGLIIEALKFIVQNSEDASGTFVPKIVQTVLEILFRKIKINSSESWLNHPNADESLSQALFHSLIFFVPLAREHIRQYLDDIFELVRRFWGGCSEELFLMLVALAEEIAKSLSESFALYLGELVPMMMNTMYKDASGERRPTHAVLHAFRRFAPSLEDHLFLIVPDIIGICDRISTNEKLRRSALLTLLKISENLKITTYCSIIFHTHMRLLKQKTPDYIIILNTLFHVVFQLDSYQSSMYVSLINKMMLKIGIKEKKYFAIVKKFLKNRKVDYKDFLTAVDEPPFKEIEELSMSKFKVSQNPVFNQEMLKNAWNTASRATREDWIDWLRVLSIEMIKENPSSAIRHCHPVVLKYPDLAREIFFSSFVSCWLQLEPKYQDDIVSNLENAFESTKIPQETIYTLLNLVEFLERCHLIIPVKIGILGRVSEKIKSYAKALHYKEAEFITCPKNSVESIISIYNHLQQPESADGMLEYALKNNIELKESWYEKLRRWENALEIYEKNSLIEPFNQKLMLGRLRCLNELGQFQRLLALSERLSRKISEEEMESLAPLGATAAWNLGRWDSMRNFVGQLRQCQLKSNDEVSADCSFFEGVLAIHDEKYNDAQQFISQTRKSLDSELTSLVGESYNRAYPVIVKLQKLVEMEEIVNFKKLSTECDLTEEEIAGAKNKLKQQWDDRLKGCKRDVDVWNQLLSVRSLLFKPSENIDTHLRFSSLCRRKKLLTMSLNTIGSLLGIDANTFDSESILKINRHEEVKYVFLKHLYDAGMKSESMDGIRALAGSLPPDKNTLKAKCLVKHGEWQSAVCGEDFSGPLAVDILSSFEEATLLNASSVKAFNAAAMMSYKIALADDAGASAGHFARAARNFFAALALRSGPSRPFFNFQNALRVLTILFERSSAPEVMAALAGGFESVGVEIWLDVIPQIIARVKSNKKNVTETVKKLLLRISESHPQALIYPLTVAIKSADAERSKNAALILTQMKARNTHLVDQALLVSGELVRVAILWPEICMEELKEASRCFLKDDHEKMIERLEAIHMRVVEGKTETVNEAEFKQHFAGDFHRAFAHIRRFKVSRSKSDLDEGWSIYCALFRDLQTKIDAMVDLDLALVSPRLLAATDLEILVPQKYSPHSEPTKIQCFTPRLHVISSKRKPRKLSMRGSDGRLYTYVLKGREDLRQDERVMQLLGLTNAIFAQSLRPYSPDLAIRRYAVVPLSPASGLIEWVPQTDTLYQLIQKHRRRRGAAARIEARLLAESSRSFARLALPHKAHSFERVLARTSAGDLRALLWDKSADCEAWFERRSCFARSLAAMSMVGYVLGLGDRHPSNLLVERPSGRVVHIDFGDCFEVAAERESFPERVPFRLTRMLVRALGVSGVEGLFRRTCAAVLGALRENRESVLAALEAFVYDPLISWRLVETASGGRAGGAVEVSGVAGFGRDGKEFVGDSNGDKDAGGEGLRGEVIKTFSVVPNSVVFRVDEPPRDERLLSARSVKVLERISAKLTGRDFGDGPPLGVRQQVRELIAQATAVKNLCQCYSGWCPFW